MPLTLSGTLGTLVEGEISGLELLQPSWIVELNATSIKDVNFGLFMNLHLNVA